MVKNEPRKTQKLIIPQGTIESMDTTIIEIPLKLQGQPVVIAKKKDSQKSIAFEDDDVTAYLGGKSMGTTSMGTTQDTKARGTRYFNSTSKYPSERSYIRRGDTTFLASEGENPPYGATYVEDPMSGFPSSRIQSRRNDATYVVQRNSTAGVPFQDERYDPMLTFGQGISRIMAPTTSQMSGRYNFQTNIPQQAFRITCDLGDDSAEVDEIEKAERVLILGELQKYHDARRKYLMSFCEQAPVEIPYHEVKRAPSVCKKKSSTCHPCEVVPSCQQKTTSATSMTRSFKQSSTSVGCDPCVQEVMSLARAATEDVRSCGSKQGMGSASDKMCIPTILATNEIQRIRQQFQDATKKLEKAMACMPCSSHSIGKMM